MVVGKVELDFEELEELRQYILIGLTGHMGEGEGEGEEGQMNWPISNKIAVGIDRCIRILEGSNDLSFSHLLVFMPPVPLASDMESTKLTYWLQIVIAIANDLGLTKDTKMMSAIEKRVTEEVLEGKAMAARGGIRAAQTEGGKEIRKFAWSTDGKLAAEIDGRWYLANGESVVVAGNWAIMDL